MPPTYVKKEEQPSDAVLDVSIQNSLMSKGDDADEGRQRMEDPPKRFLKINPNGII